MYVHINDFNRRKVQWKYNEENFISSFGRIVVQPLSLTSKSEHDLHRADPTDHTIHSGSC